jgi:hypothetical protein
MFWTYGITFWGTASSLNIEILQRYQNEFLRTMVNAPWYVSNKGLHVDLRRRNYKIQRHGKR